MDEYPRVLFVDDDPNILESFRRHFGRSFEIATATCAEETLKLLDEGQSFAVIVSDMRMPGMDGASLLAEIRRRHPNAIRILLTGLADQPVAVRAINEGHVFAFLNKPIELEVLGTAIEQAIGMWKIKKHEREFIDKELNDIALS